MYVMKAHPLRPEDYTYWLMRTFPSDESDWARFAVVKFDDRWLKKLWKLTRAHKQTQKTVGNVLHSLVVWDSAALFFSDVVDVVPDQANRLENYDYIEITADDYTNLGDNTARTECDMLHVLGDAVSWQSSCKYTSATVETPRISLSDFECEVHGRNPRKKRTCLKCMTK